MTTLSKEVKMRVGYLTSVIASLEPDQIDMEMWHSRGVSDLDLPMVLRFIKRKVDRGEDPRCGTVACIAGWAVTAFPEIAGRHVHTVGAAREILGLSVGASKRMFHPKEKKSKEQVLDMLTRYYETGEVQWNGKADTAEVLSRDDGPEPV